MKVATTKVKPDKDGYYSVDDALPREFDLCILVGENKKTAMGWRTGNKNWDGHSIKRIDKVIAWKKAKELD